MNPHDSVPAFVSIDPQMRSGRPCMRPTLKHYSDALDEIHRLRCALAYEAGVIEAHLDFKSFPKSRRDVAEDQVRRMRRSAQGLTASAYSGTARWALDSAMGDAMASPTLTAHQWETRHETEST